MHYPLDTHSLKDFADGTKYLLGLSVCLGWEAQPQRCLEAPVTLLMQNTLLGLPDMELNVGNSSLPHPPAEGPGHCKGERLRWCKKGGRGRVPMGSVETDLCPLAATLSWEPRKGHLA